MFQQAIAASDHSRRARWSLGDPRVALALIVVVAVATRIVSWWNPVAHPDDPFYLLVGREMLAGHFPYVDVWDRKPFGLFALYALIFAVTGGNILAFNLVATAFAVATAMVVRAIARRLASDGAATLAGIAYVATLPLLGGQNGQSPVFYNLLMALAGLFTLRAVLGEEKSLPKAAYVALALCGLSIAIKQTALVEGCWFGLTFLALMIRRSPRILPLIRTALTMIGIALLPLGLSVAGYYLASQEAGDTYVYATFLSILEKQGWGHGLRVTAIQVTAMGIAILFMLAAIGALRRMRTGKNPAASTFLGGWMVFALIGYLIIPNFFEHYALPMVVPLAVSAATLFEERTGRWVALAFIFSCVVQPQIWGRGYHVTAQDDFAAVSRTVEMARQGGCIFIGDGPAALYLKHPPCRSTRYLFPEHLSNFNETTSVDARTDVELTQVMATRPAVIVTQGGRDWRHSPAFKRFEQSVTKHYRLVFLAPRHDNPHVRGLRVWQRNDLPLPVRAEARS